MKPRPSTVPLTLAGALIVVAIAAALRGNDREPRSLEVEASSPVPTPIAQTADPNPPEGTTPATDGTQTPTISTPGLSPLPLSTGTFTVASASGATFGQPPFRQYAVAIENGLSLQASELALFVDSTLADPRSWIGDTVTGFERVDDMQGADFTLVVATPDTVDALCAPLETRGSLSCGNNGWIALNVLRWTSATQSWPTDLETYRRYLVNHEVGHYILGPDHPDCPEAGALAPIMLQQSINLDGCSPNGWVFPDNS